MFGFNIGVLLCYLMGVFSSSSIIYWEDNFFLGLIIVVWYGCLDLKFLGLVSKVVGRIKLIFFCNLI